jgi:hypothetical protein
MPSTLSMFALCSCSFFVVGVVFVNIADDVSVIVCYAQTNSNDNFLRH